MIHYAKKLDHLKEFIDNNLSNRFDSYSDENIKIRYGFTVDGIFHGIAYYYVPNEVKTILLNYFFKDPSDYDVVLMIINHQIIHPHTDSGTSATINIYLETGNAITRFYEKKNPDSVEYKITNQTDGSIYKFEDLSETFSFKAEPYDAWLLDVSKIHSVEMPPDDSNKIRIAYCISSKESFNHIYAKMSYQRSYNIWIITVFIVILLVLSIFFL